MKKYSKRFSMLTLLLLTAGVIIFAGTTGRLKAQSNAYVTACNSGSVLQDQEYAYENGWLLCAMADANVGSTYVLKETSVGSGVFTFYKGTGGWYSPAALIALGVPVATANDLVPALAEQFHSIGELPGERYAPGAP